MDEARSEQQTSEAKAESSTSTRENGEKAPAVSRADLVRELVGNGSSEVMARQIVESLHQLLHGHRAPPPLALKLAG